jgi:hypothetical protein
MKWTLKVNMKVNILAQEKIKVGTAPIIFSVNWQFTHSHLKGLS